MVKRCLLILDLKLFRLYVKGKHFIGREFQRLTKEIIDIDILVSGQFHRCNMRQSVDNFLLKYVSNIEENFLIVILHPSIVT